MIFICQFPPSQVLSTCSQSIGCTPISSLLVYGAWPTLGHIVVLLLQLSIPCPRKRRRRHENDAPSSQISSLYPCPHPSRRKRAPMKMLTHVLVPEDGFLRYFQAPRGDGSIGSPERHRIVKIT